MERDRSIDFIKGVAIGLVMTGHCIGFFQNTTVTLKDDITNSIINSFHMPLFFLLGGMLHKKSNIADFIKKRFCSVCIPLSLYAILNGVMALIIYGLKRFEISDENMKMLSRICKFQGGWFLISYFLVCSLFCIIQAYFANRKLELSLVIVLLLVVSLLVSTIDKSSMTSYVLTTFIGLFYYYIGTIVSHLLEKSMHQRIILLICGLILMAGCLAFNVLLPNDARMYSNEYENIWLFLISSLLGSLGMVLIGKGLQHFRVIEIMGRLSLPIMAIQFPIYQTIGYIIERNNIFTNMSFYSYFIYIAITVIISTSLAYLADKYFPAFSGRYRIE